MKISLKIKILLPAQGVQCMYQYLAFQDILSMVHPNAQKLLESPFYNIRQFFLNRRPLISPLGILYRDFSNYL